MLRLPGRSLFWRAFLTFWGAMAVIVTCGMLLTAAVSWYRFQSLDGLSPTNLTADATQIARTQGRDGLARWLEAMNRSYVALTIYIVDDEDHDLLGRQLPAHQRYWLRAFRASPRGEALADGILLDSLPIEEQKGVRVSWWDPQPLRLPDGQTLVMIFLPFDASHWEILSLSPVMLVLLVFALIVTGPFCWALMRHVTRPLDQLRQATQALAEGHLDARAPKDLSQRPDELGKFARDFDIMATRLQSLVDTREQLLRNVAHELRSPLARLQLAVELARRKDETQDMQIDRIEREGHRLDDLVGHTLQLARMTAMPPPATLVDFGKLVGGIIDDARFEASGRGVSITSETHGKITVRGEPDSLASAVENVLRNALRYSPDNSQIHLVLRAKDDYVVLTITDQGPGVPQNEISHLFEPFYRVRATASKGPGAGLGLTIAQTAIHGHGGKIEAHNVAPHGLSVSITLPLA